MILTTTPLIDGKSIVHYHGIVTGEAILGANGSMLMVSASGTAVTVR
jgi:uncharacterized protein YbjQ (UPF0145 family)